MVQARLQKTETESESLVRTATSPECLSAAVLTLSGNVGGNQIGDVVAELKEQSAAIHSNDLSRVESMLIAQAHTLDGLFAKLTSNALSTDALDKFDRYMKLALRAQNQARATLQTLSEMKAPKQISFVNQANIGNQVQVNNNDGVARAEKKSNKPNKLLEAQHGERLDTRTTSKTGGNDSRMETLGTQCWPRKR